MTQLSVNINKIALIRNSRGRNYPDVVAFSERFLELGACGITLHPRPDQRHARYSDAAELKVLCDRHDKELNIEGYPTTEFMKVVLEVKPTQCTLVPDEPGQVTSDHGWDLAKHQAFLTDICAQLKQVGVRSSLFVDYDTPDMALAKQIGADRVELYTEPYAETFGQADAQMIFEGFANAAQRAYEAGLEVNAGHDLNLDNLARFIEIPHIAEVSIGHALVVESLQMGMEQTMQQYMRILNKTA